MAMDSKNSNDDNKLIAWEEVRKEFEGIKHLGISYTLTSNNDGLHDFYAYGTDNEGKAQAKFLNNHPKILIAFLKGLGYNISQEQLRKSSKENNNEPEGALCFDIEKEYQEFVQELHGNPNSERKKQLAKTRCLINKHRDLLNGFESKIKRHVEMKIDKAPWLLEQLMSWTKLIPDDTKEVAKIYEYVFYQ